MRPHPVQYAGETAASKLDRIRKKLAEAKVEALVVSDPHNLAWAFNLRGGDVAIHACPLAMRSFRKRACRAIFLDPVKVTNEAGDAVGELADLLGIRGFQSALELARQARKVRVDEATGAVALTRRIEAAGGTSMSAQIRSAS